MFRFIPSLTLLSLIFTATLSAHATPRTRTEYVVTETNPITGGNQATRRFTDRNAANQYYAQLSRAHWVKWRFLGVNEPLRFRRFQSSAAAQQFIESDGPSKTGKLGVALLTDETRNTPTRVKMTTVVVPVTDGGNGGNGGSNNGTDVVEVIDRIIGIIDR